jgi:hypothetical protein
MGATWNLRLGAAVADLVNGGIAIIASIDSSIMETSIFLFISFLSPVFRIEKYTLLKI